MSMAKNLEVGLRGDTAVQLAKSILYKYFQTHDSYLVRHHIDSFDQFLQTDLQQIIQSQNPIMLLKEQIGTTSTYEYKVEVYIGGESGDKLKIGSPSLSLKNGQEVRVLFPNEARLRNLTYQSLVQADILVRITFGGGPLTATVEPKVQEVIINDYPLFHIPILLHSRYCLLSQKPAAFLQEAGECIYDQGGYFIVDGAEKVLITNQQQAFNTLYLKEQKTEPKVSIYGSISCLSPTSRKVKRATFYYLRRENTIQVGIPMVRKPVPLFVLFRALGLTSDKEIVRTIFPDENGEDTKLLEPLLIPSITEAYPFLDTYSAIQYIKTLTKGFSVGHVIDILRNQLFIHVPDRGGARVFFLAECVRKILRRVIGLEPDTSRDDTRNQRCLTSGFLTQMLFQGVYSNYVKAVRQTIDKEYAYNPTLYRGANFVNIFNPGNQNMILRYGQITEGIMRGFKGKWGSGVGEEKSGVLQAMSRLSFLDFLSHCRRVVLEFDTGMKLTGPRQLNTSQFGYFCTSETPTGASIGVTKNLTLLTAVSTATNPEPFENWLYARGGVERCTDIPSESLAAYVPVYINGGVIGFIQSTEAKTLVQVLKLMKWSGCLPAYASIGFDYAERRVFVYLDDGRPMRPLIHLEKGGVIPVQKLTSFKTWKELILGSAAKREIYTPGFVDPLAAQVKVSLNDYITTLTPLTGAIEYIDPYEQNQAYIASFPEHITTETSHLEIHPSTMVSILTGMIPFANHNQSPRNQLSCSQSKQGLSLYATNFQNRYDNTANILCYGEAPIVRTMYYDFLGEGNMPYGNNIVLAIGCYTGYNQEDGILINGDALQRGLFRNINYRSYEGFEEDDKKARTRTRIAHPQSVAQWTDLKPGLDYKKLDERGIIRVGEYVDENTVIIGRYIQTESGQINDASVTPQVWTYGRVESVVVTLNNIGHQLVKVRVTQDRIPELGDKFSNRHGQKGTIGMIMRAHDMPRSASGLVPDMMMNPHAIPSRMTIAQLLEMILGKAAAESASIGNATLFMNEGDPSETIGRILQDQFGFEKYGNEYMYNGQTGTMIPSYIFVGPVFTMRLKHMVIDKWNARGEGRRERRTHLPTGGRGNQGGLRIGEMERDAICAHGITSFVRETYTKRADGTTFVVCNGCGTIPIYNEKENLYICPLCDGPVKYVGETANNLEILPPTKRSLTTFSAIELPYCTQLLNEELQTFMNMGMRYITSKYANKLSLPKNLEVNREDALARAKEPLPERVYLEANLPEFQAEDEAPKPALTLEDLRGLGVVVPGDDQVAEEKEAAPAVPATVVLPAGSALPSQVPVLVQSRAVVPVMTQAQAEGQVEGSEAFPEAEVLEPLGAAAPRKVAFASQPQFYSAPQQTPTYVLSPVTMAPSGTAMVQAPVMASPPPAQFQLQTPGTAYVSQQVFAAPSAPGILQVQEGMTPAATTMVPVGYAAPATFVVDTSPEALAAEGLTAAQANARRSRPTGSAASASAAPASRPRSPSGPKTFGQQAGPVPPSTRVNIIKEA